jgi:FKBP12-rapamycin complex-associated protein
MKALRELARKSQARMIPYLDQIVPVLLESVLDKSFTKKRKNAVKTLTAVIQSTGCVVVPYYKYTTLLETLIEILK